MPTDNDLYGYDANKAAIGVELCYGGDVNFWEAYTRFTWYHAYLCQNFGLNEKDIVSHKTLDPARKIDPENVLGNKVLNFSSF